MTEIIIEACDVWDYAHEHMDVLMEKRHIIARNDDFGVEVIISVEDDGAPYLAVEVDDEEEFGKILTDRVQANLVARQIYDEYLTSKVYETLGLSGEENTDNADDDDMLLEEIEIEEREDELDTIVENFVEQVMSGDITTIKEVDEEVLKDLKEHFLEYMARKHKIEIFRPMYLYDKSGEKHFTEYPYENMVFEDEGNPVYI